MDCVMRPPEQSVLVHSNPDLHQNAVLELAKQFILDLSSRDLRDNALSELDKLHKQELIEDLGSLLWYSSGAIGAFLQEIVSVYYVLSPLNLSRVQLNRVCMALSLLQCVASHPNTTTPFLEAQIPLYVYPFLNTTNKTKPYERLRFFSLRVIDALLKHDDIEVINFLLSSEIIPLCLRTMEVGNEMSKTVATGIVHRILLKDVGLDYICTVAERFYALNSVLVTMVTELANQPSPGLLINIIKCYLRLSDNPRACDALRSCIPDMLRNYTFYGCFGDNDISKSLMLELIGNLQ